MLAEPKAKKKKNCTKFKMKLGDDKNHRRMNNSHERAKNKHKANYFPMYFLINIKVDGGHFFIVYLYFLKNIFFCKKEK